MAPPHEIQAPLVGHHAVWIDDPNRPLVAAVAVVVDLDLLACSDGGHETRLHALVALPQFYVYLVGVDSEGLGQLGQGPLERVLLVDTGDLADVVSGGDESQGLGGSEPQRAIERLSQADADAVVVEINLDHGVRAVGRHPYIGQHLEVSQQIGPGNGEAGTDLVDRCRGVGSEPRYEGENPPEAITGGGSTHDASIISVSQSTSSARSSTGSITSACSR